MWGKKNQQERFFDSGKVICVVVNHKFQQERQLQQKKRANE